MKYMYCKMHQNIILIGATWEI